MNPETEKFEQLRRLLALKRHEQPRPGYFEHFSSDVISRIRAGDHRESLLQRLVDEAPWLQRLWSIVESRPVGVGAFGTAVCGLLLVGIILSGESTPNHAVATVATEPAPFVVATPAMPPLEAQPAVAQLVSSTNPVAPSVGSLFDQFHPKAQPANLILSGQ